MKKKYMDTGIRIIFILFVLSGTLGSNAQEKGLKAGNNMNYDIHYHDLYFEVDPAVKFIKGSVKTIFSPLEDNFSQIAFDLVNALTVDSVLYHGNKLGFTRNSDILAVSLPLAINAGAIDSIKVYYQGVPPNDGFGSFDIKYHNNNSTPIIYTLSEPYGAKVWWPCKQSLNDKADSVDIRINHPNQYKAASNGKLISETTIGNRMTTHWKHRHPITAYLVCFAVTNYSVYSDFVPMVGENPIEVLNYVYPEDLNYARASTPVTIPIMQFYNEMLIPYPYKDEKYGHAQFEWGGGMEHQTMSFMVSFGFDLIAHELAHQWFGDYITCKGWQHIWINEGFATYCESLCHEFGISGSDWRTFKANEISYITSISNGSVFVNDTSNVNRIFDSRLSYSKGGMVLHMVRNEIGDTAFFKGLKRYLTNPDLINGYASTEDFQQQMETESGKDLDYFFLDWIYGQGYPSYIIKWGQQPDKTGFVRISQTQSHGSVDYFELNVPIRFSGEGKDTTIRFFNTSNNQEFSWNLNFKVSQVVFDPDLNLVSKSNVVTNADTQLNQMDYIISPNPVHDLIIFKTKREIIFQSVILTDLNGRIIKDFGETGFSKEFSFDMSGTKPGIYLLYLKSGTDSVVNKIIKQ